MTTKEKILNSTPSKEFIELSISKSSQHELRVKALLEIGFQIPNSKSSYPSDFVDALQHSKFSGIVGKWNTAIDKENAQFVLMSMMHFDTGIEDARTSFEIVQDNRWNSYCSEDKSVNCFFIILPLKKAQSIGHKRSHNKKNADEIIQEVLG